MSSVQIKSRRFFRLKAVVLHGSLLQLSIDFSLFSPQLIPGLEISCLFSHEVPAFCAPTPRTSVVSCHYFELNLLMNALA